MEARRHRGTAPPDGSTTEFLELVEHSDPSVVEEFCGQHHVTLTSSGTQAEYLREYRLPDAHRPFTHDGGVDRRAPADHWADDGRASSGNWQR